MTLKKMRLMDILLSSGNTLFASGDHVCLVQQKQGVQSMRESESSSLPVLLIPGLSCTAQLYSEQIPALWQFGPVTLADHRRDDSMEHSARRILATARSRFALAELSMGGYIAFEIMRQAPERVAKLALLDTGALLTHRNRLNAVVC
jgi:pimeloyl-ACP methyl ester carboxylesterase